MTDSSPHKTRVVNFRDSAFEVYIGRPGKGQDGYFGNPVRVGAPCPVCTEAHARGGTLECYAIYLDRRIDADPEFAARVKGLSGKVLGCFCKVGASCHGHTLASRADALAGVEPEPGTLDRLFNQFDPMTTNAPPGEPPPRAVAPFDWDAAVKSDAMRVVRKLVKLRCRSCGKEYDEARTGLPQVFLDALGLLAFAAGSSPVCGECAPPKIEEAPGV